MRLARAKVRQVDPRAFIFSASAVIAIVAETSIRLIRSVKTLVAVTLCSCPQSFRFAPRDKAFPCGDDRVAIASQVHARMAL